MGNICHNIRIIDLGCGTGTISLLVSKKYPKAEITCLDIANNMLEIAKGKLKGHRNTRFIQADIYGYEFDMKYDAIISSLTLHHLNSDADKINFYKKIYSTLNEGGIFINADIVLAATDFFQNISIKKWKEYMNRAVSEEEIENKWLAKYKEEDYPARLLDQVSWLEKIGFRDIEIFWKYYNFAVFGGLKNG